MLAFLVQASVSVTCADLLARCSSGGRCPTMSTFLSSQCDECKAGYYLVSANGDIKGEYCDGAGVTLTSDIDFMSAPGPELRQYCKIGKLDTRDLFGKSETPGPNYVPPSTLTGRSAWIGLRRAPHDPGDMPGPGEYEQDDRAIYCSRSVTITSFKRPRSSWMETEVVPGPGSYSPNVSAACPREPAFTFGKKSRRNRRRDKKMTGKRIQIGIDRFLVTIQDPELDEASVLEYVRSHRELKTVLKEVMQRIMEEKPPAPLGYMRDYFNAMKPQPAPEEEEKEELPALRHQYALW